MNGDLVGPITPKRGLRQGFPISPYLFILCAEGISNLVKRAEDAGSFHGMRICRGVSSVSHLLFAYDRFFFFRASSDECDVMRGILQAYESVSRQAVNYTKSGIFYSFNVSSNNRLLLFSIIVIDTPLYTDKYIGLPSLVGRSKKVVFKHLKDWIWKNIHGWRGKRLSKAGRDRCSSNSFILHENISFTGHFCGRLANDD